MHARSSILSFMLGSQTREILPTAVVSRGIFVFSSSVILVSLLLCRPSPFPHLEAFLSKICARYFRHPGCIRSKAQNKGKKYSIDRKRNPLLRFRAFLTDPVRMIFHVASGFPNFPPFLVRRRLLKHFKTDLMAFSICLWIFNVRSSPLK